MKRLFVVVEGDTEEKFVKEVLAPHLATLAVWTVATKVTTRYDRRQGRQFKGGGNWGKWLTTMQRLTKQQRAADVRFTTLFDLYALPSDFPGVAQHGSNPDSAERAEKLEAAMHAAVGDDRLIPYLQRHEVEALVFVGLDELKELLDPKEHAGLERLRRAVKALPPEDINDGNMTAPSKRLLAAVPSYVKTVHGPLVLREVGLARLREACPRFDAWVASLEALGAPPVPSNGAAS